MKLAAAIALSILLIIISAQIYSFFVKRVDVAENFAELEGRLAEERENNEGLNAQLKYYLNPANLEKELKARFNYKRPGEKVIIIVPGSGTTTEE